MTKNPPALTIQAGGMEPGTIVRLIYRVKGVDRDLEVDGVVLPDGTVSIASIPLAGLVSYGLLGLKRDAKGNIVPCANYYKANEVTIHPSTGEVGAVHSITVSGLIPGTVVTVTWAANGESQTASALVGPDGIATVLIPILDPGVTTVFTVKALAINDDGTTVETTLITSISVPSSTIPTPSPPTETARATSPTSSPTVVPTAPPSQPTLHGKASAVSKSAKLRTWISGDPAAAMQMATVPICRGPYKFRIQKQRITTIHSGGKLAKRITWTTLSGKYTTNKKSGIWYYRTVNLKKGAYRSVISKKCGFLGLITNTVTLKK